MLLLTYPYILLRVKNTRTLILYAYPNRDGRQEAGRRPACPPQFRHPPPSRVDDNAVDMRFCRLRGFLMDF
nr:MAG TPA: hypothetical protein [Caudoviricetes sp.]